MIGDRANIPGGQAQEFDGKVENAVTQIADESENEQRMEAFGIVEFALHHQSQNQKKSDADKEEDPLEGFLLQDVAQSGHEP